MDPHSFAALLTPAGQALLDEAVRSDLSEVARLRTLTRLRSRGSTELASAALETAVLRQRASRKFSRAAEMYFTRDALEQASGEAIAAHRFRQAANT